MNTLVMVMLVVYRWQAFAHVPVDGNIHALLAPATLRTLPLKHQFDSPFLGGMGLVVEGDLNHRGGAEIAAIYMNHVFSIRQGDQTITEKTQRMYISTGYRYWPTPWMSAALAFYSSFGMGDAEIVHNDFGQNNSPPTSAQSSVGYGFDLSLQIEALHRERYSIVLDSRYAYSITSKAQEDGNLLMFMLGLKYFVQSRSEISTP